MVCLALNSKGTTAELRDEWHLLKLSDRWQSTDESVCVHRHSPQSYCSSHFSGGLCADVDDVANVCQNKLTDQCIDLLDLDLGSR